MRIRQVKPAFWSDARVAAMPPAARLFYIGLWMIADDTGWLRWDEAQIGNELYGYETRGRRERNVRQFGAMLVQADRVELHPCGHAFIPTLVVHQHLSIASKQVRTYQKEHAACHDSPNIPAETRGNPPMPAETRESPPVKGNGGVNVKGGGNGGEKGHVKGSARPLAPEGAGALMDEPGVPDFLRIVQ